MLGPMLLLDVLVLRLREFVDEPSSGRRGVSNRLTLLVRFGESRPQPSCCVVFGLRCVRSLPGLLMLSDSDGQTSVLVGQVLCPQSFAVFECPMILNLTP